MSTQEWGVRHPDGKVTVRIDGHAHPTSTNAVMDVLSCDQDCDSCDGGKHGIVVRTVSQWQDAPLSEVTEPRRHQYPVV